MFVFQMKKKNDSRNTFHQMRMNQLRLKWFKKNNKPPKKRVMKKL